MLLAEALIARADMQKQLAQVKARLAQNVKVQEGDQPAESPQVLLGQFDRVSAELTHLVQRINRTNSGTAFSAEKSLADVLADRDALKSRHTMLRSIAQEAIVTHTRFTRSEVRFTSTVDVAALQSQADDLARQHRALDSAIQAKNWSTELLN